MLQIEERSFHHGVGLWRLGFRPFFLGAGILAALLMAGWMGLYLLGWNFAPAGYPAPVWHAHEMIFGYAVAVIAGFLLTAVKNWTNVQTLHGSGLMALFALWVLARMGPFVAPVGVVFLLDILFMLCFSAALLHPIIKARSWNQLVIAVLVLLLAGANILFYLGLTGMVPGGTRVGLYAGLYLVVAMILLVGRRVIPFFIERGCDRPVQLTYRPWLDISIVVSYGLFVVTELSGATRMAALLASLLVILNAIRLVDWHARGIWKKPLLWVLYIAYIWITAGFLLKAVAALWGISPTLSAHAFTVGGIGMMTLGMMARVALGHTGRNVFDPPASVWWMFLLLLGGAICRVLFPLLSMEHYMLWIAVSQLLWIAAFALFVFVYAPILIKPRVDGRYG